MAEQSETGQKASSQFERVIESLNIGLGEIEKAGAEQIVRVFKRFGWSGAPSSQSHHSPKPEETLAEEGIVFTKNNVLLKANGRAPGYVFVRAQETVALGLVLILNWLPNAEFFGRESASHSKTLSIDSSKVEEIRVFFSGSTSPPGDIGHVIVRGLNDTVHVFEFISGGLAGFMKVLQDCTYLKESSHDQSDIALHTFTVSYPQLSLPELHPGQAEVRSMLTVDHWSQLKHTDGSLTDPSFVQNVSQNLPLYWCVCVCTCMCIHASVWGVGGGCILVCMYMLVCVCVCVCVLLFVCCVCLCAYIHIYFLLVCPLGCVLQGNLSRAAIQCMALPPECVRLENKQPRVPDQDTGNEKEI